MKNSFYYLFAVICSRHCSYRSDDDDEKMVNPVPLRQPLLENVCNLHTMVRRCRVRKL